MIEWACRTYGWRLDYVISEAPAIHLAMLYRCYAQGPGGVESGTLLEDELAAALWGKNGAAGAILGGVNGKSQSEGV